MVQGSNKLSGGRPGAIKKINSAKLKRQEFNSKKVKLGAPKQLPKNHFRAEAIEDRQITKAIGKVIEQKVAAKVIQSGGKVGLKDIMKQGLDATILISNCFSYDFP